MLSDTDFEVVSTRCLGPILVFYTTSRPQICTTCSPGPELFTKVRTSIPPTVCSAILSNFLHFFCSDPSPRFNPSTFVGSQNKFFFRNSKNHIFRAQNALVREIKRFLAFRLQYLKSGEKNRSSVFKICCRDCCSVVPRRVSFRFIYLLLVIFW